jgi:hypothetical protein
MAEEYITVDKYRADLADLRADLAQWRADLTQQMAQMELRLTRWMLVAAGIGGLLGGLIAAVSKLFG